MVGAIIGLLLFVPAPTKCILLTTQSSGQSNKLNSPRMSFSMLCSSSERKLVHADWSVTPVQKYSGTRSTTLHDTKNLNIVYVDEHMVVVDKPSGVRCVPGTRRNPSILDDVFNLFGCESGDMDKMVVHRLDMGTSGLVVFARTNQSLRCLHDDFRDRKVRKKYLALICGHLVTNSGEIDLPLERDHLRPPFMRVATNDTWTQSNNYLLDESSPVSDGFKKMISTAPKVSLTYFEVLSREWLSTATKLIERLPVTRVSLFPVTGRTHQLRVHCAAFGHPIIGDTIYGYLGDGSSNGGFGEQAMDQIYSSSRASLDLQRNIFLAQQQQQQNQRLHLHATELNLWHPFTRAPMIFHAPPPF